MLTNNATGNNKLPSLVPNPSIFHTLQFERGVDDWAFFSKGLNLLIYHSLRSFGNDSTLADDHALDCLMTVMDLKIEVDNSIIEILSSIPKV